MRALSERNIADIFSGRVTNWSQVGGENAPINLYGLGHDFQKGRHPQEGHGLIFRSATDGDCVVTLDLDVDRFGVVVHQRAELRR